MVLCDLVLLEMLDPQKSLGQRLIPVILLWRFEFNVFAPKRPFLASDCISHLEER